MLFTFMLHSQLSYKPQQQHTVLVLPSFSCKDKHDYFFLYVQGLLCLTVSPFMVSTYVIILRSCSCLLALSFFGSRSISRVAKTENSVPRSFFAPKPKGNACYAG